MKSVMQHVPVYGSGGLETGALPLLGSGLVAGFSVLGERSRLVESLCGELSLRPLICKWFTTFLFPAYDCTIRVAVTFSLLVLTEPARLIASGVTVTCGLSPARVGSLLRAF